MRGVRTMVVAICLDIFVVALMYFEKEIAPKASECAWFSPVRRSMVRRAVMSIWYQVETAMAATSTHMITCAQKKSK